jgi:hypothetical protein
LGTTLMPCMRSSACGCCATNSSIASTRARDVHSRCESTSSSCETKQSRMYCTRQTLLLRMNAPGSDGCATHESLGARYGMFAVGHVNYEVCCRLYYITHMKATQRKAATARSVMMGWIRATKDESVSAWAYQARPV